MFGRKWDSKFRRDQTEPAFFPSISRIKNLDSFHLFFVVASGIDFVPTPCNEKWQKLRNLFREIEQVRVAELLTLWLATAEIWVQTPQGQFIMNKYMLPVSYST